MASFTFSSPGNFANGATLGAYPVSAWAGLRPSGSPLGSPTNTQTVTNQSVTFTGLTAGVDYYAAVNSSTTNYVRFTVPSTALNSDDLDSLAADVQEALDAEATSRSTGDTLLGIAYAAADTAIHAVYKPLFNRSAYTLDTQTSLTRLLTTAGGAVTGTNSASGTSFAFYINPTELAISGKTTKINIQAVLTTNNVSLGTTTVTCSLYPVTVASANDAVSVTLGSVVSGSAIQFVNPGTSVITASTSGDLDIPSAGLYVFTSHHTVQPATDSAFALNATLRYRHV